MKAITSFPSESEAESDFPLVATNGSKEEPREPSPVTQLVLGPAGQGKQSHGAGDKPWPPAKVMALRMPRQML